MAKFDWKSFSVLSGAHAINDMYSNFLPPLLPFLVAAGAFKLAQGTALVAAFTITSSFAQPFFGYLIDQKGQRWLLYVGTIWMALLLGLTGFTKNYYLLLVLAGLAGMGTGAFHPQATAMITGLGSKRKGTALSTYVAFGSLGMALGPLLLMPLVENFGLKVTGYAVIPGVMAALLLYVYIPKEHIHQEKHISGSFQSLMVSLQKARSELLKIIAIVSLRSLVFTGLTTLIPFYLIREIKMTPTITGVVLSLMLAAGSLGGIIGGSLSDVYGKKPVIAFSLILTAPLLWFFLRTHGALSIVLLCLGQAALMASFSITVVAAQEMIPDNKALASGLSMGFAIGVGGLAITFIGKFADVYGIETALQLLFLLPLLAAFFALFLDRETKSVTSKSN